MPPALPVRTSRRRRLDGVVGGNPSRMSDGDIHVVKKGDDWTVTIEGIRGDLVSFDTEDEALRAARRVAAAARSDVVLDDDPRLADASV